MELPVLFVDETGVRLGRDVSVTFGPDGAELTSPHSSLVTRLAETSTVQLGLDHAPIPLLPILRELLRRRDAGDSAPFVTAAWAYGEK